MHRKIGKGRACGSGDILADRQTDRQTDTHTDVLITILGNKEEKLKTDMLRRNGPVESVMTSATQQVSI